MMAIMGERKLVRICVYGGSTVCILLFGGDAYLTTFVMMLVAVDALVVAGSVKPTEKITIIIEPWLLCPVTATNLPAGTTTATTALTATATISDTSATNINAANTPCCPHSRRHL